MWPGCDPEAQAGTKRPKTWMVWGYGQGARTESSFIPHRNGDHTATPAFVGRLEERANIAQRLRSAKESVYLHHKGESCI